MLIVNEMEKSFSENGIQVQLEKTDCIQAGEIDVTKPFGIAFPVAFQSTFPFVWSFISNSPYVQSAPVFIVDTLMAFSGAIVGLLKKALTQKGYNCIGACENPMPNNWLTKE